MINGEEPINVVYENYIGLDECIRSFTLQGTSTIIAEF